MNKAEVLLALEEIIEVSPGTLQGTESIKEWDSIATIGLIAFADERFNKSLTASQIALSNTVDDIIRILLD